VRIEYFFGYVFELLLSAIFSPLGRVIFVTTILKQIYMTTA